jgi:hypothetical protein
MTNAWCIDYFSSSPGKHVVNAAENKSVLKRVALEIRRLSTLVNQVYFERSHSVASWTAFMK